MKSFSEKEILAAVDHTILGHTAVWAEVKETIDDGIRYGVASICLAPAFVRQAAEYAAGRIIIGGAIGFPNGYTTTSTKVFEAQEAIAGGAGELDMVINLGWVRAGNYEAVLQEINAVKAVCGGKVLKVIIEACLLTEEEKIEMCRVVSRSDADYIKTSTGFSTGGATAEDVALMKKHCDPRIKIKAAGGISSLEDARRFLSLGASRLGTSRIIKIIKGKDDGAAGTY